jgi:hypothetical protein
MLGRRRAGTTGTPSITTLPQGDLGAMDSHHRHHHHVGDSFAGPSPKQKRPTRLTSSKAYPKRGNVGIRRRCHGAVGHPKQRRDRQ